MTKLKPRDTLRDLSVILDLLAMAMEAGLDFNMALERVAEFAPAGEVLRLFQDALAQMNLGERRLNAFEQLQNERGIDELRGLVLALRLSETLGAHLAPILQTQAHALRQKRLLHAEHQAQQVPVKMIFPLVFLIFPCTLATLFAPLAMKLLNIGIF